VPVEHVEELHAEVGVDPFGEHGDGLGDVEVLAAVEELADAEGARRVAKGEVRRGRRTPPGLILTALPIDEFTAAVDTMRIHSRNDVGTAG
jgi:hypothetical protein